MQNHTLGFPPPGNPGTPKRRSRKVIVAAAGAAVLLISGGVAWASMHSGAPPTGPSSEDVMAKCMLGTWTSNPRVHAVTFNKVPVGMTEAPHTMIFNADGTGSETYAGVSATGTAGGHQYGTLQNGKFTFDYKNTFDLYANQNEYRIDYSGTTGGDNIKFSVDGAVISVKDVGPGYVPTIATCTGDVLTMEDVDPSTAANVCHDEGGATYCDPEPFTISFRRS
jgi:hypothetical protein